jgi:transposase
LSLTDGVCAPTVGRAMRVGHRYRRRGILHLFAALLVHRGQTMAGCYERKRFVEFESFLSMIFGSLWCRRIRVLHLILDNGPTHAPKQIESWIAAQRLAFVVKIHWLPINASWLDQVEIIFSPLQRKALRPVHFADREQLRHRVLGYLQERNRNAKPIRWTYTKANLRQDWGRHLRACA